MLICPFSVLDSPFGTLDVPFCIFPLGRVSCPFGFSVLVVPFAVSGFEWAFFSFAVKGLGCE